MRHPTQAPANCSGRLRPARLRLFHRIAQLGSSVREAGSRNFSRRVTVSGRCGQRWLRPFFPNVALINNRPRVAAARHRASGRNQRVRVQQQARHCCQGSCSSGQGGAAAMWNRKKQTGWVGGKPCIIISRNRLYYPPSIKARFFLPRGDYRRAKVPTNLFFNRSDSSCALLIPHLPENKPRVVGGKRA